MSVFQVLQRPPGDFDPANESGAVFIEDRFSWFAALLPPVWALVHGLWIELIIWIVGMVALYGLNFLIGDEAVFYLYLLSAFFIGYEAANIRASALSRRGCTLAGDIVAGGEDLAEMEWLKQRAGA